MQILIAGYGYIGKLIAERHIANEDDVYALSRSEPQQSQHQRFHWRKTDFDCTIAGQLPSLANPYVYYLAPPPSTGIEDTRLKTFLDELVMTKPKRILYVSTTAVYGDAQGRWIDETAPLNPTTARAKRRYDAENRVINWCKQQTVEWVILRVTGIYGPGCLPIERIKQQTPVLRIEEAPPSNRIHAFDLADICVAANQRAPANSVYNISDGHPTSMSDYFLKIAKHANLPAPPQINLEEATKLFSSNMMEFITESKKIDNHKVLKELSIDLKFPTLDLGLEHCFKTE